MSAFSIVSPAPSEPRLKGGTLFLLAGLAALGARATNIMLTAVPRMGAELAISSPELGPRQARAVPSGSSGVPESTGG